MNRFTSLVVGALVAPTLAISGGLERSELPTSFLYEDGNYLTAIDPDCSLITS